jgi:mono/diheme cytochrome c family protein
MRISNAVVSLVLALSPLCGLAQTKTIQAVPLRHTSPVSGVEMYKTYCAVCHGVQGKGNGPAASALKSTPTDLTMLTKQNGGKFPMDHVLSVLQFGSELPSHGSKDMPVWGPLFHSLNVNNPTEAQQRTSNIARYLKTIQVR